jgi:sigma-B regulation protein RsbU (phosphoserine phosphatase)
MRRLRDYIGRSFQRKLLLFNLLAVFLTASVLFGYLVFRFRDFTDLALQSNSTSTEQAVREFLDRYAQEKAASTWLQVEAAQNSLAVLGRTAQTIVDNRDALTADRSVFALPLFTTELREQSGSLTTPPEARYDAFVPPPFVESAAARADLETSALLNLSMDAVQESNSNITFIYYVGGLDTPVTRGFPNKHLVEILGEARSLHFWNEFFPETAPGFARYFTDPAIRERVGDNPITVTKPYDDAAGQGLVLTMFYPLWDGARNEFAGAVGADITLSQIIENVLSFRVGETGFAFLVDGDGEVIAMPEVGFQLFGINLEERREGGLVYYKGSLAQAENPAVQTMAQAILAEERGYLPVDLGQVNGQERRELIAFASLPPLSNSQYQADRWRIVVAVPESEVFATLNQTRADITRESTNITAVSLLILAFLLAAVTLVSMRFARSATRDLRTLAGAAQGIAAKQYDADLRLTSRDEIGHLGEAFVSMSHEIRDYTANLEAKVAERTAELKRANDDISRLNDQLRGENLRLGAELDVARRLQMMVLPPEKETRAIEDLDIACFMRPADEVGGDYYDVLKIGDTVFLGIGDVTGHGLPAGIVMLMAQTAYLTLSQSGEQDMRRIMLVLNRVLYHNIVRIREDKNMTLAVLQYRNREFMLVGQHESVLICRAGGAVEVIDTLDLGFPMGLEEDISDFVDLKTLRMEPGDVMLLYTDGITEAENAEQRQFGIERLQASLAAHHTLCAEELKNRILADVYAFIGETRIYDDISLLVVKQR